MLRPHLHIERRRWNPPGRWSIGLNSASHSNLNVWSVTQPTEQGAMLGWMVQEKGIEPHVPVWQRPPRNDGTFPNSDFHWIERSDEYRCPAGHALRKERQPFKEQRSHITKAGTIIYRSS